MNKIDIALQIATKAHAGQKYASFSGAPYLMLTVGVCGAFTTFSTFSADSIRLMDNGQWLTILLYLTLSIIGGFLLFYLGRKLIW